MVVFGVFERGQGAERTGIAAKPGGDLGDVLLILICQLNGHRYPRMGTYVPRKEKRERISPYWQ